MFNSALTKALYKLFVCLNSQKAVYFRLFQNSVDVLQHKKAHPLNRAIHHQTEDADAGLLGPWACLAPGSWLLAPSSGLSGNNSLPTHLVFYNLCS